MEEVFTQLTIYAIEDETELEQEGWVYLYPSNYELNNWNTIEMSFNLETNPMREYAKGKTDGEKEGDDEHKGREQSNVEAKGKTDGEEKENSEDVTKDKDNAQDSVTTRSPPTTMGNNGFRFEECDSSNIMCMDKNKRFAAGLLVPGNESPHPALLIQNKGKGPLSIKISAPAFVQLEETDVELQKKQDKKVKVYITNSGTENLIILRDGSGKCSLDFKDLIVHNSAEPYVSFLSKTLTTVFLFVATTPTLTSGWMCMSFRRIVLTRSGLKYQRLTCSCLYLAGQKQSQMITMDWIRAEVIIDWYDKKAPMTPLMPVTRSLSSLDLPSRPLSKEGCKD
ncbi:uncharacterized protein LOC111290102 [Durio zibethinus]|uniref:Uncharacterized protein LOC111290102 n=1 Tax=Durio zibethinus TaxID=66656 RepID=A0A6P5Y9Z9_DURZI|nr:uncharacterized protein LOC111290102 [Durio zibethinus]